ncbi:MAG: PAS domain S-box protein [Candidatus Brocadiae bacterium]|nr:PAS domain S-box protein [Candidatus Brocadiia bacterium]
MSSDLTAGIVEDLNAGRDFRGILDALYHRLRGHIPVDRLGVAILDPAQSTLSLHAVRSDMPVLLREGHSARLANSSLAEVLRTRQPRILPDLEAYLRSHPESEATRLIVEEGFRSSLTLPLIARGNPFGLLFFSSRTAGAFVEAHARLAALIAGHISVALERSLLVEELRASKEYTEGILQNSADAIVVIDNDDRIRSWNRGAERMFGWTEEEILGKEFNVLIPEDLRLKGELRRVREVVEREGFLAGYESVRVTRDGRRLTLSITATAIRDRAGRITGRSAILRDMTRLQKLQQDLVRSQSLAVVGELAATVAHEIKNPLAGISGAIQVIADAIPATDHRREIVSEILAQVHRLDETVRDLLVFARPWTLDLQEVDTVDIVHRVVSILRQQVKVQSVTIRTELPDILPMSADPRLLQEILFNLLQNGIDAMPRGGTLRVTLDTENSDAVLRIIDTGMGISPEHMARLFSPFFTTKTRGTGLGLAISRRMIEAHGGRVHVDSEVGKGTEVRVSLPLRPEIAGFASQQAV